MEHLKKRLHQLLEKKIELDNYLAKQLPKSILQEAIQGKLVPQIAEEGTAQELLEQIKVEKQKTRVTSVTQQTGSNKGRSRKR